MNIKYFTKKNFFSEKIFSIIKNKIKNINYKFYSNDLYEFYKTEDFSKINLEEIRKIFLDKKVLEFLEKKFKIKINKNKIDIHSLKLKKNNYLLPHNDKVKNRKIAFILYLSNLKKNEGGEFCFVNEKKILKKIIPQKNLFLCFQVDDNSLHLIKEVEKDIERITIGGWYYER